MSAEERRKQKLMALESSSKLPATIDFHARRLDLLEQVVFKLNLAVFLLSVAVAMGAIIALICL